MFALTACGGGGSADSTTGTTTAQTAQPVGTGTTNSGSGAPTTGGTQTTTPAPAPAPTPRPTLASTAQIIEYYGDSTIWGCDPIDSNCSTRVPLSSRAPEVFRTAIQSSAAHTVRNEGLNGDTACAMVQGLGRGGEGEGQWSGRTWAQQMAQSNATVVIINHGINEAIRSLSVSDYRNCLRSLAVTAQSANNKYVIFETPNPIDSGDLSPYLSAMRSVAAEINAPVIDQHTYLTNLIGGGNLRSFIPDGTHPSASTYERKGTYSAEEFRKFIR